MAPFPSSSWRLHIVPEEWAACLDAWVLLAEAHFSFSSVDFARLSAKDESLAIFLVSYMAEAASSTDSSSIKEATNFRKLRKSSFLLSNRLLGLDLPPEVLLQWGFLADLSKVYGQSLSHKLLADVWARSSKVLEPSLRTAKISFIKQLEAGLKGDPVALEKQLKRLNHLLHTSPDTAIFFMEGSDFLDGLINCYKLMNPPLRGAILTTAYLCILGLTEGVNPNISHLTDQLYALKAAAEAHKTGPTNVNDSLVPELITATPILKQIQERIESGSSGSGRITAVISSLQTFRKAGVNSKPKRLIKRKINKGKFVAKDSNDFGHGGGREVHVHQMSLISQVQDLFPDLGSGFVAKLLDEYNDETEQVIAHLLEESLPLYLADADRNETLSVFLMDSNRFESLY